MATVYVVVLRDEHTAFAHGAYQSKAAAMLVADRIRDNTYYGVRVNKLRVRSASKQAGGHDY